MEAPQQYIQQMEDKQNEKSHRRSNPAHSTSGNKPKLGMATQVPVNIQTKPSSGLYVSDRAMGEGAGTRGNKPRKLGMAPQAAAKQGDIQTKPSNRFYMSERVMGEGAKNLSPEKMAALEIDIFKPLDFYEILLNRLKESDKGRIISNINEL